MYLKIIDRYMLRQFIQTFLICYLSLTGLYIVFDAFTNLEDFLQAAEKHGGLWNLMGPHYAYRSLFFFDRTAGMLTLVAAMFTVTWIQRHNELTALMAAGISRVRVILPVTSAAVVIAFLATANRELLIPRFREELARTPQDLMGTRAKQLQPRRDYETDILIRGGATFAALARIRDPKFLLPITLDDYGKQLVAANAYYCPPEGDRPGGYLLEKVRQPKDLADRPSLCLGKWPVVITPRDAPGWLKPDQCFVVSNVDFEQLTGGTGWRQFSSTAQLIRGLRNPSLDFGADVRVAIHSRVVQPFLDITLLFLGLPLVLSRQSRNVFIAIGLCVLVVSIFVLITLALQQLGASYLLDPALAAWAPLMLFVPVAVAMAHAMWE